MYKERNKVILSIHVCLFASVVTVVGWKLDLSFYVLVFYETMVPLKNPTNLNFYLFFFSSSVGTLDLAFGRQLTQSLSCIHFRDSAS